MRPGGPSPTLGALVPRHRTARVAVLGSSVQRAASSGYSSTRSSALRRRIVVGSLVVLSLVLITLSFRSDVLDPAQSFGASVMRPFEIAANRVSRPFRDAVGWASGLVHAKSENERLRHEVEVLRRQVAESERAQAQNLILQKLLDYRDAPSFPKDFDTVAASVLTNPTTFDQAVTISVGSNQGVALEDVVVTVGGLVGQVTRVSANVSRVTLISDANSAVRAVDANNLAAVGLLVPGPGSDTLVLNRIGKDKKVEPGDKIITAGSPGGTELPSIYPRNIPIGVVTSADQSETDIFKRIQVEPFVDLTSLQSVLVLVPKKPGTGR
jgi:rod shape-determining protein MreC